MLYRFEEKLYQKYAKYIDPSIAQLVERRTVELMSDILRSLVRIRLEGIIFRWNSNSDKNIKDRVRGNRFVLTVDFYPYCNTALYEQHN